jgi:hypothetical protein
MPDFSNELNGYSCIGTAGCAFESPTAGAQQHTYKQWLYLIDSLVI